MTTRKVLVEQVLRKLSGGNLSSSFAVSELEVGKQIDQVTNAIIRINCLNGSWDDYITTFDNVSITLDESRNIYYCVLPSKVISIPNQMGVFQVSTMKDQSNIFLPVTANASWLYGFELSDVLQGNSGYYNEQDRLYFVNYTPFDNTDKVLLKLIVDRSSLDEEEDYQVPPDIEEMILLKTFNFYQGK
jgi:hypothetical protein